MGGRLDRYGAKAIGRRVSDARRAQGLGQQDLATKAGLQVETISRAENGAVQPKVETLGRLAQALDVKVALLLGEVAADLPARDQRLLEWWHRMNEKQQDAWLAFVDATAGQPPEEEPPPRKKKR